MIALAQNIQLHRNVIYDYMINKSKTHFNCDFFIIYQLFWNIKRGLYMSICYSPHDYSNSMVKCRKYTILQHIKYLF